MVFIAPILAIVLLIWAADALFYTPNEKSIENIVDKNDTQKSVIKSNKK